MRGASECCNHRRRAESLSSAASSLSIWPAVVNIAEWPCRTAWWPMIAATIDLPTPFGPNTVLLAVRAAGLLVHARAVRA